MYLTAVVTEIVAATFVGLGWVLTDWSTPVFLAVAVPPLFYFCLWFLPVAHALWVGVDYVTDAANGEKWAALTGHSSAVHGAARYSSSRPAPKGRTRPA